MKDIFLYYLDGNTAIIGQYDHLVNAGKNNSKIMLDKAMLCMLYYDRVPNKMRTGWDYLTTFSLQPLTGTKGPQDVLIPDAKCIILACTDERLVNIYTAAVKAASEQEQAQSEGDKQENVIPVDFNKK
jgi:hypothetical protein